MTRSTSALALLLALALLSPALAWAAPNPSGLNLAWNACFGDGGQANRQFACNTNIGIERLYLSFVLDQPIPDVIGAEMHLQLAADAATLPAWWTMLNAGTCRPTALSFNPLPALDAVKCVDWSNGSALGADQYVIGTPTPNGALINAVEAVPATLAAALTPGVEYALGSLGILHRQTTGLGACAGCTVPVCVLFTYARIVRVGDVTGALLSTPANSPDSDVATWQSGQITGLTVSCNGTGTCSASFGCAALPTPTRSSTWSLVKSLYR